MLVRCYLFLMAFHESPLLTTMAFYYVPREKVQPLQDHQCNLVGCVMERLWAIIDKHKGRVISRLKRSMGSHTIMK